MDNTDTIRSWVEQDAYFTKKKGYFRKGNILCEPNIIYSYNTHFPMAVRGEHFGIPGEVTFIRNDTFSVTTSRHLHELRYWLTIGSRVERTLFVPTLNKYLEATRAEDFLVTHAQSFLSLARESATKLANPRVKNHDAYRLDMEWYVNDAKKLLDLLPSIGKPVPPLIEDFYSSLDPGPRFNNDWATFLTWLKMKRAA